MNDCDTVYSEHLQSVSLLKVHPFYQLATNLHSNLPPFNQQPIDKPYTQCSFLDVRQNKVEQIGCYFQYMFLFFVLVIVFIYNDLAPNHFSLCRVCLSTSI